MNEKRKLIRGAVLYQQVELGQASVANGWSRLRPVCPQRKLSLEAAASQCAKITFLNSSGI